MNKDIQTTQQTAKTWKALQAIGTLGAIAATVAGMCLQDGVGLTVGLGFGLPSLCLYGIGRAGAWWFHG